MEAETKEPEKWKPHPDLHYILIYKAPTHRAYFIALYLDNKERFQNKDYPIKLIMPLSKNQALYHIGSLGFKSKTVYKIPQ